MDWANDSHWHYFFFGSAVKTWLYRRSLKSYIDKIKSGFTGGFWCLFVFVFFLKSQGKIIFYLNEVNWNKNVLIFTGFACSKQSNQFKIIADGKTFTEINYYYMIVIRFGITFELSVSWTWFNETVPIWKTKRNGTDFRLWKQYNDYRESDWRTKQCSMFKVIYFIRPKAAIGLSFPEIFQTRSQFSFPQMWYVW